MAIGTILGRVIQLSSFNLLHKRAATVAMAAAKEDFTDTEGIFKSVLERKIAAIIKANNNLEYLLPDYVMEALKSITEKLASGEISAVLAKQYLAGREKIVGLQKEHYMMADNWTGFYTDVVDGLYLSPHDIKT